MGNQFLGEVAAQTLVETTLTLGIPAVKIDEIVATVNDLTCTLIPGKVIFQGVVHEQIFFVDPGGLVRHQAADIRFSGFIPLPVPGEGVECRGQGGIEFIGFKLLPPSSLAQVIVLAVKIALFDPPFPGAASIYPAPRAVFFGRPHAYRTPRRPAGKAVFKIPVSL